MAYNPQPVLGVASWNGNPPIATLRQLNSTIAIISTVSLSNFTYISTVSNSLSTTAAFNFSTLESQIQGLILSTGGSTASWASFPALTNVNLNNKDVTGGATVTATQFNGNITGSFFSTTNLQTSSINGIAIDFFNSTITLQGVTITNNSIITQNITQQKTIFEQVVGGINAVASAVSEINSAVGGFLSNTFGVVQQVYYGARAVGAVVDLTTSVVELATAGQALADSRTINTISGGNVGAVYETFNHTSQLQFSTLMSTTLTFYRTTTAANPNLFFGREVIISSYISAGTKCLRSIGDPMHMPIASTQLLSTTNFIQSFGQWSPILANDNNLNANTASISSLTVSSIYGNWFSTGTAFISSINNQPISAFINTDDPTFNSVSTSFISTGRLLVSSINDSIKITSSNITGVGNLGVNTLNSAITVSTSNITGVGNLGVETLNSVIIVSTSNISGVNNVDLNILNSAITVTGANICNVGQFRANNGIFNNAIIVTNNAQVGSLTSLGAISGTSGSFSGNVGLNTLNATGAVNGATAVISGSISGGSLFTLNNTVTGTLAATSAVIGALTVQGALGTGSLSITGTTTAATINATTISNSGLLTSESISTNNLSTGAVFISSVNGIDINSFGGATTLPFLSTTSISSGTAFIGTLSSSVISTGASFISSINGINITSFGGSSTTPPFLSTNTISAATASISSIFTNNLSSTVANISSLSIYGNLVFFTAATGYDISKTLTSTVTNYDKVSSLTQDIFGYKMNLTTTGEPQSFDMGSFFAVTDENSTLWSKKQLTYSGELADGQAPTINIVPGDFVTNDRFDVKNIATNGAILNIWNPFVSGGLLLQMTPGTYYRFTYSGSAWTFAANPTNIGATYFNTFAIYQGWEQTTISTGNIINLEAGAVNIPGFTAMDITNINYLTAGGATFSTIVSPYMSTSALFTSSINGSNINTILNPTTLPFLSTTSISTAQIKTSSITANTLTFTSPLANPTGSWDINRTFYSNVVSGSYDSNVSSLTAQILNYNLSATIPNIASFFFGAVFTIQYNDALWASQFLIANSSFGGTIILLNASATNFFDCQNQSPLELLVTNNLSGTPVTLFSIPAGNLTIYRVTATVSAGVTTWSYAVSPGVYSPTTVANNLLISADLQNTYISSINRVQFNTGDVYFASPIYAPNAYFDNVILNNVNASTLSSINVNAGNIKALAISTNSIATNLITTNTFVTSGALTVPAISTNSISSSLIFTSTLTASSRVITPSISTLTALNGFNTRLLNNPGNVLVYTNTVSFGNGSQCIDINTDPFVPGVYTCSAVCRGNVGRTLEATLYYNSRTSLFCENANAFDNYNVCWWHAYTPGYVRFTSRTDGPGDTFDIFIYMISGQYKVLGDDPPFPQASSITATLSSINTGTPSPIVIGLSSLIGSTITMQAKENISLLANILPPAYISSGNITIAGSASVEIIGQQAVVGGLGDVDIEAVTGDVTVTAASTIIMAAPNINLTGNTGVVGTLYMNQNNIEDVKDLYLKRNLIFQSTSTYIADLGHIYGNTASPGGGLAIDYMYGLFFNSAGNDANIYASGGYFNLRNNARGIEVAGYNPAGTGDSAFYVANNELYLATGAGHDVITNSGRNISMNAAFPGGFISQYTSTIYITSLTDTYITADGNTTLRADRPGKSITSIASTITLQAATTINLNGITTLNDNPIRLRSDANHALAFGNSGTYNVGIDGPFLVGYRGGALGSSDPTFNDKSFAWSYSNLVAYKPLDMCNNNINNIYQLNFSNSANIDGAYGNQLNFNASNSYFLGDLRFYGSGRTLDIADNQIYACRYIYGSSSGNLSLNAVYDVVIENNQGANISLNSNGSIGITASNISIGGAVNANCNAMSNVGAFSRYMISTELPQPVIQYAYVSTGSAFSGTMTITLPQRYTSVNSYIPFAVVQNDATTTFYVSTITRATFEIGWSGYLGFGDIIFSWNTLGT